MPAPYKVFRIWSQSNSQGTNKPKTTTFNSLGLQNMGLNHFKQYQRIRKEFIKSKIGIQKQSKQFIPS